MKLTDSVRQWIMTTLPYDESDSDIVQALNEKDAHGLLVTYYNWMSRLVQPTPRRVEKSTFFEGNPHRVNYIEALSAIEADIVAGCDLTKYLSKGVRVVLKLPSRRRGASDLDLLLNDWGVHHLHLSKEVGADGFVLRTGPLLFVRFVQNTAYFLDIADHGQWTKESVAAALINEFPDAGGVHVINGVVGVSREHTEAEHAQLRANGVNTVKMIDGKAVIGGGINLSGTSIWAVREADKLLSALESFEEEWNENEKKIRRELKEKDIEFPVEPKFEFGVCDDGPVIIETTTHTALQFM